MLLPFQGNNKYIFNLKRKIYTKLIYGKYNRLNKNKKLLIDNNSPPIQGGIRRPSMKIKNTLVACACVLPAVSAPVFAQSSVTIYGVLDASIQTAHTGTGTTTRMDSSAVAPSRIGFQGTEDLGGGMAAVFRLENGFNLDTGGIAGNGALFNRESWVGLRGAWGQIQAGVNYTPLFSTYVNYSLGELNTLGWGNATNNFVFVPTARVSNSIRYVSPNMGGVTVRAVYAFGTEGADPRTLGDTASLGANFKSGAFSVDLDYLQQKYANSTATTAPVNLGKYYLGAASYDFGFIKPALLYQIHRGSPDPATAISSTYANPNNNFYELNATIPNLAGGTLLVSAGQYRRQSSSSGNATSYGVRYDYRLSKRTGLYAGVSQIRNNSNAAFTVNNAGGAGVATTAGKNVSSMIVGIVSTF
ncbi:porin [Herbaspirillum rhizosphaerae]|uniref:Porin n=1 Tax=Herbaspirillum rhizosphaerae TaxID=346179 RepID=A0ABW8ZA00_9BURK